MHDHLVEIIFTKVSVDSIGSLLQTLTLHGKTVLNYYITCASQVIDWTNKDAITTLFQENTEFGLFINLINLQQEDIYLPKCGISVYKMHTSIDLEINFQLSDLDYPELEKLAKTLMKLSKSIADSYDISNYFCGLEPANDPRMQLFNNENIGYLLADKNNHHNSDT